MFIYNVIYTINSFLINIHNEYFDYLSLLGNEPIQLIALQW